LEIVMLRIRSDTWTKRALGSKKMKSLPWNGIKNQLFKGTHGLNATLVFVYRTE
jgi:hypothetical protein